MALQAPLLLLPSPPPLSPSACDPEISSHGVHMVPSRFHVKPIFLRRPRNSPSWETRKFEVELWEKLSRDIDTFGEDLDSVIQVCTQKINIFMRTLTSDSKDYELRPRCLQAQIFSEFLHEEYGGPGTLLVDPFTDMLVALKENNFSGATIAARTSILWAQNFVDQDWEIWNTRRWS